MVLYSFSRLRCDHLYGDEPDVCFLVLAQCSESIAPWELSVLQDHQLQPLLLEFSDLDMAIHPPNGVFWLGYHTMDSAVRQALGWTFWTLWTRSTRSTTPGSLVKRLMKRPLIASRQNNPPFGG